MTDPKIRLTVVTVPDCEPCQAARDLANDFIDANRTLAIEARWLDGLADPEAVVETRAAIHPTFVLEVDGVERARLPGPLSLRKVLHRFLPVLYHDDRRALVQLRRQLGSSTETFPSGRLRGRVRQAEKLELIRVVPLFVGLSARQLAQLARLADELERPEGETLIEQGQPGDEFFIVVSGAVDVTRDGRLLARLGDGECFGEMSLLDHRPRSATVVTTSPTNLLAIHRTDFDRHLMRHPAVMRTMLTTLSNRLR